QLARDNTQERAKLDEDTEFAYANSCPTCRLFGSTSFTGRIAIGDAYLTSKAATELRDGVGIDRLTGGASHGAKFELEVVSTGVIFETDIHLRNFEIWQLGMLFIVIQDMEDELIHLGSGRSRGLGKVTATISDKGGPPNDQLSKTRLLEIAKEMVYMQEMLCTGSVTNIAALIGACQFAKDAYVLLERFPAHVVADSERADLLRFRFLGENAGSDE